MHENIDTKIHKAMEVIKSGAVGLDFGRGSLPAPLKKYSIEYIINKLMPHGQKDLYDLFDSASEIPKYYLTREVVKTLTENVSQARHALAEFQDAGLLGFPDEQFLIEVDRMERTHFDNEMAPRRYFLFIGRTKTIADKFGPIDYNRMSKGTTDVIEALRTFDYVACIVRLYEGDIRNHGVAASPFHIYFKFVNQTDDTGKKALGFEYSGVKALYMSEGSIAFMKEHGVDVAEQVSDAMAVVNTSATVLLLVGLTRGVEHVTVEPKKLNKHRAAKGKPPVPSVTTIRIGHVFDSKGNKIIRHYPKGHEPQKRGSLDARPPRYVYPYFRNQWYGPRDRARVERIRVNGYWKYLEKGVAAPEIPEAVIKL